MKPSSTFQYLMLCKVIQSFKCHTLRRTYRYIIYKMTCQFKTTLFYCCKMNNRLGYMFRLKLEAVVYVKEVVINIYCIQEGFEISYLTMFCM
jgi:hypothetical protein